MIPAFNAWTESPEPGISTSSTVSAIPITSTSLWPAPTVSSRTTSLPAASSRSAACSVASASPPRWPRVPIERMKTPGSRKWSESRIRSPSSAPCVNGLDGSTEITPDRRVRLPHVPDERADQRRLADAGRPGDADDERRAGLRVELADELVRERVAVLDQRDRPGERAPVAAPHAVGEIVERPGARLLTRAPPQPRAAAARARPSTARRGGRRWRRLPRPSGRRTRPSASRRRSSRGRASRSSST